MPIRRALLAMILGGACALARGYPVPSFDCANTTTQQELRICRSPQLAELDGRHADLVERAVRAAPDRAKAVAEMDAWLERVRNPCQTDACLVDAYTGHIAELERTLPPPAPPPAFTMPRLDRAAVPATTNAASAPPAPAATAPPVQRDVATPPPPESDDDEEDGDDNRDYAIAAAIALLAVMIAAAVRVGLRKRPRA